MARIVIDSNFLQSDGLRGYLADSPANYAVITDYAAMEAYKADTLDMLYRSMEILGEFPRQVIILKGTQAICGLLPAPRRGARRQPLPSGPAPRARTRRSPPNGADSSRRAGFRRRA
jgi:hypothetical protein